MKGGKLFNLLTVLSKEELKEFRKVIASPIYNTNPRMMTLYEQLRNQHPDYDISQKGKEKLYKKVFPGEAYDNYKIHRLFTNMTQVLEEYLLLIEQRNNAIERHKNLLRIYEKRKLYPFFQKEAENFSKTLEIDSIKDLDYYQSQIYLNNALYYHPLKNKNDVKDKTLDQLIEAIDRYFALAKMRHSISLKNRERLFAKPSAYRFLDVLNNEKKEGFLDDSFLFQLFDQTFQILNGDPSIDFQQFEDLLFDNLHQLRYDKKVLFFSGLNYINRQLNRGKGEFARKAFDWYQFALNNNIIPDEGSIGEVTFGNIVICACRVEEFEWAKQFMEDYKTFLDPKITENVIIYHQGLLSFYQGDFEEAYSTLLNFPFIPSYFIRSRLTAIRAIFEQFLDDRDYFDLLNSQIVAFQMALKRAKTRSEAAVLPVTNCINIIKGISRKVARNESKKELDDWLEKEFEDKGMVALKGWLIQKVGQIQGGR